MIRALPLLYVLFAVLTAISFVGWLVVSVFRKGRIVVFPKLVCLLAALGLIASTAGLARYSWWLTIQIGDLPYGSSREEVLRVLGEPTHKIDPYVDEQVKRDDNAAIWYYDIGVWPFQAKHYMEFGHGKLLAK